MMHFQEVFVNPLVQDRNYALVSPHAVREKKRTGIHTGPPYQETPHDRVNSIVTIKELCYKLAPSSGDANREQTAALKAALGADFVVPRLLRPQHARSGARAGLRLSARFSA